MQYTGYVYFIILVPVLCIAIIQDVTTGKIKNSFVFPVMATGLILHLVIDGVTGLLFSFKAIGIMFVLVFICYAFGFFGAGDAKLLICVASLTGAAFAFGNLIYAILLGAIATLVIQIRNKSLKESLKRFKFRIQSFFIFKKIDSYTLDRKAAVKFAIYIAAGSILEFFFPFMTWIKNR